MAAIKRHHLITSLFLLLLSSAADGVLAEQRVYIQRHSITDYLYKYDLPAMNDYTYCFWLNMAHGLRRCYPVSISSIASSNQHFYAWEHTDVADAWRTRVFGASASRDMGLSEELLVNVKYGWHKHCFVNKNGGYIKWFLDRQTPGVLEEIQTGDSLSTIPSGSALILLQEQDAFKGGLSLKQVCVSKMSMFNMWNTAKTLKELNALGCKDQGNVVNMDNINSVGDTPEYISERFPCPDIKGSRLPKGPNEMMLCKKEGLILADNSYSSQTSATVVGCAKLCSFDLLCQSANFKPSEKMCQLNTINEKEAVLESDEETIHLSSVDCR